MGEFDAPQAIQDPHDLFLIDHDPVGVFKNFLHHRMFINRLFACVLHVDILVDHTAVERPGTVERQDRDQVGEAVGLHLHQEVADPGRVELEDTAGLAPLKELVRRLIVERQAEQVERLPDLLLDELHRGRQAGQVAEAEEVHLEKAGLLDVAHFPLSADDFLLLSLFGNRWSGTMSQSGRSAITTPAAWVPTLRAVPSSRLAYSRSLAISGSSSVRRLSAGSSLSCLFEGDVQPGRDQLGDLVDPGQGMFRARPTSLRAALAAIVPKVPIWATLAAPYFLARTR